MQPGDLVIARNGRIFVRGEVLAVDEDELELALFWIGMRRFTRVGERWWSECVVHGRKCWSIEKVAA